MNRHERAEDYRFRLRNDFEVVLRTHGVRDFDDAMVDDLVETAMHPIEHLLLEVTS